MDNKTSKPVEASSFIVNFLVSVYYCKQKVLFIVMMLVKWLMYVV